uniref:UTP6 small subunit processome component n=1 Tax=Oncorhynchus tshawytscha TaxID=74940 RepID=A0A8C8M0S3_ONCTS
MAEIVQQRIENRIPELEQLERVGLFSKKEVKSMLKRATALEYKLHRLIITKVDFIAYIQYEINVLELIKKRRSRIGYQFKREEIEYSIISRINSIFRRATTKWKDDVQLWLSHIAFCKKWNTKVQLSKVFSSMLAIHPEKPALWIMAAKSELEDRNLSESARQLFLRALRFHPESKKVYQEYFRMELLHAEKLRKQQKELEQAEMDYEFSPEIMSGKLAELVYRDATGKIQGADFILSLLTIAAIFDFTKELQDTIIQDLQSKYTDDSLTWDFMAKRELEATVGEELQTAKGRASDIARREERCCQVYEEGLKSLNTGTCTQQTERHTSTPVHTHNQQKYTQPTEMHTSTPVRTHNQQKCIPQHRYLQVLLSSGDSEQTAAVAMAATQRYRQSVDVWCLALQTMVHLGSGATGKLFQDALKHVNPKVHTHTRISCNSSFLLCSQRGLLSVVPAVSMEIKEKYLDWSYRAGGYKKARKTFTSLHESRPFSKAFFTRMIQMEKNQLRWSLRTVYGFFPPDLWLEYIREELGPSGQPENCGMIHWRAMKMLEGESVERFLAQYTLLQTGHI